MFTFWIFLSVLKRQNNNSRTKTNWCFSKSRHKQIEKTVKEFSACFVALLLLLYLHCGATILLKRSQVPIVYIVKLYLSCFNLNYLVLLLILYAHKNKVVQQLMTFILFILINVNTNENKIVIASNRQLILFISKKNE